MTKTLKSSIYNANLDLVNKRILFWNGIFSQWHPCSFYDKKLNVTFNCAEQAMMAYKALTFNDSDTLVKIMASKSPSEQKQLGKMVKNYDDNVWNATRLAIVSNISYNKFSQNDKLKELLVLSDGWELVEASPYDKIWGIGLGEEDVRALDKSQWNGLNLLGIALMYARDKILGKLNE